jgi:23S rRNA pseudouridine1911/1915/1917 synthase
MPKHSFTITEADTGERLDHFLSRQFEGYSRARIQFWIEEQRVQVNAAPAKASHRLRSGDTVEAEPVAAPALKATPEAINLRVLYEDSDVVAINKEPGMVVHAGAGVREGTLVNALLHRYGLGLSAGSDAERPGIVHRLDRFTSGVILVARNDYSHQQLAAQFAGRTVEKRYLALVHGELKMESGSIEKAIGRDPVHRARMSARVRSGAECVH